MGVGPGPLQLSSSPDLGYLDVRIEETDYSSFAVVYIYKELEGARSTMVQLYSEAGPAHNLCLGPAHPARPAPPLPPGPAPSGPTPNPPLPPPGHLLPSLGQRGSVRV